MHCIFFSKTRKEKDLNKSFEIRATRYLLPLISKLLVESILNQAHMNETTKLSEQCTKYNVQYSHIIL